MVCVTFVQRCWMISQLDAENFILPFQLAVEVKTLDTWSTLIFHDISGGDVDTDPGFYCSARSAFSLDSDRPQMGILGIFGSQWSKFSVEGDMVSVLGRVQSNRSSDHGSTCPFWRGKCFDIDFAFLSLLGNGDFYGHHTIKICWTQIFVSQANQLSSN